MPDELSKEEYRDLLITRHMDGVREFGGNITATEGSQGEGKGVGEAEFPIPGYFA